MKKVFHSLPAALLLATIAAAGGCAPSAPGLPEIESRGTPSTRGEQALRSIVSTSAPDELIPVVVTLADEVDYSAFRAADKHARRAEIVHALQRRANLTQLELRSLLENAGATDVRPLWVVNGIAAKVTPKLARRLTSFPGVSRVELDSTMQLPATSFGAASVPEWNLTAIGAPTLWSIGFHGAGAVVANMDTGVDINHLDLKSRWRGGTDSWFDPYGSTTAPYDAIGHGTQTMGLIVGGRAGGTVIGVAPGARWIAAKIYDDAGSTTVSVIHQAFQWLLAPSGVTGDPDAPDVVNASWGIDSINGCDGTFESDFEALRAAGIVVVFAAGNSGPDPLTSISPGNNLDGFSAGAVDSDNAVASFSSRGPSACTGGIYPDVVAPGVDVKTSDISFGAVPQYAYVSGTSFSAPHIAGTAALLAGAFPAATVADIEASLRSGAMDLGPVGPDHAYGYGLVDAYAAYMSIAAATPLDIVTSSLPDAFLGEAYGQPLTASGGVAPYTWSVTSGGLPVGLSLSASTGAVTGAPTTAGAFGFTVQLEDAIGAAVTRPIAMNVIVAPLVVATSSVKGGRVGKPYTRLLTASGGLQPYTWSLAAGPLPPGLDLDPASGTVSGTPTTKGAYPFTARVQDAGAELATRALVIEVH